MTEAAAARGTPQRDRRDDRRPRRLQRRRTAPAPAASSRSAMTANSVCIRVSSNAPPVRGERRRPIPRERRRRRRRTPRRRSATMRMTSASRPPPSRAEQAMRKECGFSQSLVDDLKAHRLQIARAHLAADFGVAFDLALYALCIDLFDRFGYRSRPLDLRATETRAAQLVERSLRHAGRSPARSARQRARSRLAATAAGRRLRCARGPAVRCQAASLRLVHRLLPQAAARDRGPRRSGDRIRRPAACDPVRRLLAARPPPITGAA